VGRIVIFSATSGIARAVAEEFLAQGEELVLTGRSKESLDAVARDLQVLSGKAIPCFVWDVLGFAEHERLFRELIAVHDISGLFMAAGIQIPQKECDAEPAKTLLTFNTNLNGPVAVMTLFAQHFKQTNSGFISCVSSVAGDRGRGSITAYASSKAGLSAHLQGLANRLKNTGVLIQCVKPGYVRTPMTAGLRSLLIVSPRWAARDIVNAIRKKREVVYTPFFWKYIMLVIRAIPEPLFRKLGL
jgi:decaprenylphospho-beta-D-erythro-pentofuranosid-2-ulose 2-reductase